MRECTQAERDQALDWATDLEEDESETLARAYLGSVDILVALEAIDKYGTDHKYVTKVGRFALDERNRLCLLILEHIHA